MKIIKIGSGTTLNFTIPLPAEITTYENIEVELFVDENRPIRFSYLAKTGYNTLTIGTTNFQIKGKLKSVDSLKLKGCLFMKMNCFDEIGENENIGYSASFGVGDYAENSFGVFIQTSQLELV